MENNPNTNELDKAKVDGFVHEFFFFEGQLYCTLAPEKGHYPKDIQIAPRPCYIEKHIVYRLITPDGLKGHAINIPSDPQNDF